MKGNPEERAVQLGEYITETGATVRSAAKAFGISKSTVHKDITYRLEKQNHTLYDEVQKVLRVNKEERHLRGGDGVIARRLHDDAPRIEEHGFEGQVVRDLHDRPIHPQRAA